MELCIFNCIACSRSWKQIVCVYVCTLVPPTVVALYLIDFPGQYASKTASTITTTTTILVLLAYFFFSFFLSAPRVYFC